MKGEQLNVNKSTKKIKTNAKHKKKEPKNHGKWNFFLGEFP